MVASLLGVAPTAECSGDDAVTRPDGTYECTLTEDEREAFMASLSGEDAAMLDEVENIATRFESIGGDWAQLWMLDGNPWTVGGHSQGSNGTLTIDGERRSLYEPEFDGILTYAWSLDDGVLALELVGNPKGRLTARAC
jgi:hypothetical protein